MPKIYFNRPVIKHLEEPTVLNFFFQKQDKEGNRLGEAIYIRDTRKNIYRNNTVLIGDIELYPKPDEPRAWNCDIVEMQPGKETYDVYGLYVGEGVDFEIIGPQEPVFRIAQQQTEMALATVGYMPQTKDEIELALLALCHLGTKVKFRRKGVQIVDELTNKGWIRRQGPDDHAFGIITVDEAFENKLKREEMLKDETKAKEYLEEQIQMIRDAKNRHDIPPELADNLLAYKTDKNPNMTHYFLAKDVKKLIDKGFIL